jgi:predicted flap endonuclease-1-like 5' DNA nuclease
MDFKRFFTDLFTAEISNQYSWIVLAYLLGAFLIGFITAWLYWRRKWKNVKNELAERTSELSSLRSKYDEQTRTLELKEADLKKANLEIEELTARIRQLEEEKGQLHGDLHASRLDLEKVNTVKGDLLEKEKGYLNKLEDFDTLVLGLKTKNQNLAAQADQDSNALNELAQLQSKFNALTTKLDATEKSNAELNTKVTESVALGSSYTDYDDIKAKLAALETEKSELTEKWQNNLAINESYSDYDALKLKLEGLETENAKLIEQAQNNSAIHSAHSDYDAIKTQLGELNGENAELKKQLAKLTSAAVISEDVMEVAAPDLEETKEEKISKAQAALKAALGTKIALATASQKDDLKLINGVGPFIEKKLNNLGIYTFEQISQFDDELSNTTTDAIEFFPGRIQRDDWVGQAKILMGKKDNRVLGATVKSKKVPKLDDLKIIEGVGPKIEGLLKAGGINTWAELAASDVVRLKEILTEAGSRYKLHNPSTWAQQAGLAATGQWDKLDELQDALDGGRVV